MQKEYVVFWKNLSQTSCFLIFFDYFCAVINNIK